MTACEVCGQPTRSTFGVCRRTRPCRLLSSARRDASISTASPRFPCEMCEQPTRSKYGVCWRAGPCRREYARRETLAHYEERRAGWRRWYQANKEQHAATRAAWTKANYEFAREYQRQYQPAWKKRNPEAVKESERKYRESEHGQAARRAYLQRADRPCRQARVGCTEFAVPGSKFCRLHTNADAMRRWERKRRRLGLKLADSQNGACSWCKQPLPDDLAGTHIDHIIPVTLGGPDLEWNLALLHGPCNMSKNARLTPQARALADEHGITLPLAALVPPAGGMAACGTY